MGGIQGTPTARLELAGRKDKALQAKSSEFQEKVARLKAWVSEALISLEEMRLLRAGDAEEELRAGVVKAETLASLGHVHLDGLRAAGKRIAALLL